MAKKQELETPPQRNRFLTTVSDVGISVIGFCFDRIGSNFAISAIGKAEPLLKASSTILSSGSDLTWEQIHLVSALQHNVSIYISQAETLSALSWVSLGVGVTASLLAFTNVVHAGIEAINREINR
ncbi:hypothetical protein AUJ59_02275 [Candidatus Beckwithbacteria bacterium CG1_02_47_37]|uniref:Uncharacterized protein n=2 Tax=Candidatus Beckwithiibacteriota TaxID=1752726 RepID=A0A1J4RQL2_9BACT|nr:MAG: hypothetical protein AUJ59_02275 [Candidatus Beckwithbacteria bacterium CG1_02_47_37]PJC66617.1 MAG: hypothetical protein CO018_01040 [Candidatus Beckwithbacteria bacterium CG_4_9_14_0_2_um_filter_47_11]